MTGPEEVVTQFDPVPECIRHVRSAVRDTLLSLCASLDPARIRIAETITYELTANAVQHAQSLFTVQVDLLPDQIRISVRDRSPLMPALDESRPIGPCGLELVAALTRSWGVQRHEDGKTVWAVF